MLIILQSTPLSKTDLIIEKLNQINQKTISILIGILQRDLSSTTKKREENHCNKNQTVTKHK